MAVIAGQRRGGINDFYLSVELGLRWTNSDYLDDISSFYADPAQMVGIGAALSSQANQAVLDEAGPNAGSLTAHSFIEEVPVIEGTKPTTIGTEPSWCLLARSSNHAETTSVAAEANTATNARSGDPRTAGARDSENNAAGPVPNPCAPHDPPLGVSERAGHLTKKTEKPSSERTSSWLWKRSNAETGATFGRQFAMMRLNCPSPAILPHILGLFLFFCLPLANAQTVVTVAGDAVSADDFAPSSRRTTGTAW